mmetsp:Transcript_19564/g.36677  ORF Transcript_19564/g.36677 Transcript_19564/m.36677 type:complete len:331 (-) Transcript_19564:301-1293(-)
MRTFALGRRFSVEENSEPLAVSRNCILRHGPNSLARFGLGFRLRLRRLLQKLLVQLFHPLPLCPPHHDDSRHDVRKSHVQRTSVVEVIPQRPADVRESARVSLPPPEQAARHERRARAAKAAAELPLCFPRHSDTPLQDPVRALPESLPPGPEQEERHDATLHELTPHHHLEARVPTAVQTAELGIVIEDEYGSPRILGGAEDAEAVVPRLGRGRDAHGEGAELYRPQDREAEVAKRLQLRPLVDLDGRSLPRHGPDPKLGRKSDEAREDGRRREGDRQGDEVLVQVDRSLVVSIRIGIAPLRGRQEESRIGALSVAARPFSLGEEDHDV